MLKVKPYLSKLKFLFNKNPLIERGFLAEEYIPSPYQSVLTITADFELAWAWRYSKSSKNPIEKAKIKGKMERENIPKILELCNTYNIPITWATVGHLFLESCSKKNEIAHSNLPKLDHFENEYWKFEGEDWFENDPCSNFQKAPEWYCPDLIKQILNAKVKHEIGCHTFSHIDCSDEVCSAVVFAAEINECIKEASKLGLTFESFVHPGHTIGNLKTLSELGFTSFQSDPGNILGYPVQHQKKLWELKRTYEFTYRKDWSIDYHIYRYKKIIDRAIKNKTICNFWFHPSFDTTFLGKILPDIFQHISSLRNEIWISTVGQYVDWLNNRNFT